MFGHRVEEDVYDPTGVQSSVTKFVNNGDQIWATLDASNQVTERYVSLDGLDSAFARIGADGGVGWLLADRLGTVRDIVNNSGQVIDHIDYDAWGNKIHETQPTNCDAVGYAGYFFQASVGLYQDWHRWYDPTTGRFLTKDPTGFAVGDSDLNRYVGNDPTNEIDATGLQGKPLTGNVGMPEGVIAKTESIPGLKNVEIKLKDKKIAVFSVEKAYQKGDEKRPGLLGKLTVDKAFTTLEQGAKAVDGDHFNFYQVVTVDSGKVVLPDKKLAKVPYIDPPPGGRYHPADAEWADAYPWFLNEEDPPASMPNAVAQAARWRFRTADPKDTTRPNNRRRGATSDDGKTLVFWDAPNLAGPEHLIKFETYIVLLDKDNNAIAVIAGFSWVFVDSNDSKIANDLRDVKAITKLPTIEEIKKQSTKNGFTKGIK